MYILFVIGRGFVTRHALFDENWRFFASSHMYLGFEILGALFVFRMYTKSSQFWGHCWSMFVAAMAFIWTPYWFNPLAFNWAAVRSDYSTWLLWMNSDGGSAAHSWHSWWKEEKGYMSRLRLAEKTTVKTPLYYPFPTEISKLLFFLFVSMFSLYRCFGEQLFTLFYPLVSVDLKT